MATVSIECSLSFSDPQTHRIQSYWTHARVSHGYSDSIGRVAVDNATTR